MEKWKTVQEFDDYRVSDHGRVMNELTGRILSPAHTQKGYLSVAFHQHGRYQRRSLSLLVATYHLPPHPIATFTTPIHKDGNYEFNHVSNLAWRPRWYACEYRRQFQVVRPNIYGQVMEYRTKRVFPSVMDASIYYGLLAADIEESIRTEKACRYSTRYFVNC